MKRQFVSIYLLLFVAGVGLVNGQDGYQRAQDVLLKARKVFSKNNENIEKVFIKVESDVKNSKARVKQGFIARYSLRRKILYSLSRKFELKKKYLYRSGGENIRIQRLDGVVYSNVSSYKDAGDIKFRRSYSRAAGDPETAHRKAMGALRYEVFSAYFPIFLDFDKNMKFNYLGVAKSGDQIADVIETKIDGTYTIQLFFGQKSHRLLLIVSKFFRPRFKENVEQRFFFSDYRLDHGFNFAHMIIVQENGEVMEERRIKKLIVNPAQKFGSFKLLQ